MQEAFAALDLPAALAESWVQPIAAQLARILDLCAAEPGPRAGGAEDGGVELAAAAGQWVTAVMRAWQTMHRAEESLEAALGAERNEWGLRPKELVRRSEFMQAAARGLHLPTMLELWRRLTSLACAAGAAHVVTAFVRPWVAQYSRLVQRVVAMYGERHRATVQFALTVTSVLTTVLLHGLGSNDMYDGEDTDESMQTGTGIGEGSTAGAKNVSDEIEGEDQVEGLQGEEGQDNEEEDPGNNEDAIDMQNDFDGKLGDADLQTDDDNSSDESDDDGEDDMDEQMGDVDPTDPTALDDKLWDDEEEKDEKEQKGEDSKVDSKASKKKDKSDIVAGTGSDDEDSGSDGGEQPEPESGSEQADDDNGSGDDDGGDAEEGDDGEEDSEGELDDRVNKDTLNRMADVEDLAEQLEMPDDLDMGGDDDAESDEEDDGLDADMNELPEDEPIDPFDPSAQPEDAEAEDAKAEGDEHSAAEADAAAAEEESAEAMEADDGASGSEAGSDGGEDQDGDDEGEKDGADEEAADPEEDTEAGGPEPDEPREAEAEDAAKSGANKPTDGIDSAMNLDGSDEAAPNASAESQQQQMKAMQSSSQQQQRQPDQQQMQAEQSQGMPDGAANDRGADSQPQLQQPQEKQRNLQPERTLADVIEKWERRLDLVMRDEEETAAEEETEGAVEEQGAPESDDAAAAPESSAHEHVKPDEAFDRVALADATEAELAQQQERPPMDVEERGSGEQEADAEDMDVDGEKAEKEPLGHEPPRDAGPPQSAEQPAEQQARPAMASMQRSAADEPGGVEAEGMDVDAEPAAEAEAEADGSDPEPEEVDVDRLRAELEERTAAWRAGADAEQEQAAQLWRGYTRVTHDLALVLTEQLRLILAPTQATQLRGDFRTGKRLNMKRIIPYIASEFRKDKIWLRRAKPARREYHVILALDNSKSMAQAPRAVELAYETLALVATALAQLDVGHIAVVAFGDAVRLLHPFDRPFDADAGARVLRHLTFADDRTDVVQLMDASLRLYDDAAAALSSSSSADLWRLQLVISDGVCQDHPRLLRQVRAAMEQRIMTVFIVLDRSALTDADPEKDSIMNTQHVSFVNGEMRVERYLDTFPFKFYVVLRDIHGLPAVLAETLRQYFSLVGSE
ncbi:hypothetical protein H4R26_004652 [Coemansia thaxteri]|uniref:VWFA domain-containing protein n=1 Tax=Coemansia thaxteri TaxID=2663907 RepID=A0A9W8BGX9_9FUNG|nr:hypothetical protein H4R26_004652 [Coemansia thaxteri]